LNFEEKNMTSPAGATAIQTPWEDCKVGFDFNGEEELLWKALWPKETATHCLPDGWSLCGTNASGTRLVAVFRVEGDLRREDGSTVATILRNIEQTLDWDGFDELQTETAAPAP